MAVTLQTAEKALKDLYLEVVADQLNFQTNPFYNQIKSTANYVTGKNVVRLARIGLNGGVGAGTEDGALPKAVGNRYAQLTVPLKNLYGQIEISDKAILASQNSQGAFVNLLNDEMESLMKASRANFSRMLYGDGSGILSPASGDIASTAVTVNTDYVHLFSEGMVVDFYSNGVPSHTNATGRTVMAVNYDTGVLTMDQAASGTFSGSVCVHGSFNNELTGLKAIFDMGISSTTLYGLNRAQNTWLRAQKFTLTSSTFTELAIQKAMDDVEMKSGGKVDFIVCSYAVRRKLQALLSANGRNIDTMELKGGFTAISFGGIPVYADRYCPEGTMFLLDSTAFTLHQLCDWRWLEDGEGHILHQVPGTPKYTATLVKYADLLCDRPGAQAVITGV